MLQIIEVFRHSVCCAMTQLACRPTKSITGLVGAISGGASGGTIGSLLLLLEQSPEEVCTAADMCC